MERSRFAQHGAALQLTPEQMAAFREPLRNDIAAALSQAVLRYIHDRSRGREEAPHNMLFQWLEGCGDTFEKLLSAR
eukprot:4369816-Alexandrium_andersonii.AAC.1